MTQNVLRSLPRAEAEQELDLLIADLHHIGLPETPEHLLLCLVEAAPERLTQVRIVGDELAVCFCVLHSAICRASCRFVGQRECTEVEHARLVDERKIQFVKRQLCIRAGHARKGKLTVAVFVQRDERQCRENFV